MKELDGTGKFGQQTITTFGTETDYRHLQTSTDIYRLLPLDRSHRKSLVILPLATSPV